ncbi:hypothetical protein ABZY44_29635 [Streptomyces sp. NPDC006544]|uniref:hypothetical protein n=1 Tax=Streptomyces sp. NPDC006544 TaxID=3154583 RepID=UPI0033AD721C
MAAALTVLREARSALTLADAAGIEAGALGAAEAELLAVVPAVGPAWRGADDGAAAEEVGAAVGEGAGVAVPGSLSPTVTEASPPSKTRPSGWALGATLPSAVTVSVVSTGTHASPTRIRTGPVA